MITILNLFSEFIKMSYSLNDNVEYKNPGDIHLGNFVILRKDKLDWEIKFLLSGMSLIIPYRIIDLFYSLDVYHKGRIFRIEPNSEIESFILTMLRFVHGVNDTNYTLATDQLSKINEIGMGKLRTYVKELTGLELPKILYISKELIKDI